MAAILGSFVAYLDATVVNVALPAIADDLGGGLAEQQWVANAYLLALGSLILVGGALGDVYGERLIFSIGVGGFGATSLLCALAPSVEVLIAARVLQGVFGALLTPSALAVIVAVFPPAERGGAIGSWTAWSGMAMLVGPLAGGQLVDALSWRWIFGINVPFVIATLALVAISIPGRQRDGAAQRVDWIGGLLSLLGLSGPVYALIRQPDLGWGSAGVVVPLLAGAAIFVAFLWHESRTEHPMLPLSLFRRRNFAIGNLQTLSMYAGLAAFSFFLVLFLQQVAGYTALVPTTIVMFLLSRRMGALADRLGPRAFMGGGPLVAAAGMFLLLRLDESVDYWRDLFPAVMLFALGLSITVAPLVATVLADAEERNAGVASGVNNAIARVAGLVAVAGLGAVVAAVFASKLHGVPEAERDAALERVFARGSPEVTAAAVEAFHVGMGIAGALMALGGIAALAGIRNPRRPVGACDCPAGQIAGAPRQAAPVPAR